MKRTFVALLALAALAAHTGTAYAQAVNRAAVQTAIIANETAINDAFMKNDVKAFHAWVAADSFTIDGSGIMKMGPDFDKMMAQVKITSASVTGSQFMWLNDTTVIHMYKWSGKGTFMGQPVPPEAWVSTVWMNKAGKWTGVFHQESVAMPMPPAAAPAKK